MNSPMIERWRARRFLLLSAMLLPLELFAQKSVELTFVDQPPQTVRVLQAREVKIGNSTLIFNRVERPISVQKTMRPIEVYATERSPASLEILDRWLCRTFSCAVYGGVTELTWWDEHGVRQAAYSNVDFAGFIPWFDVRLEDTAYSVLFFSMGDYDSELPQLRDPTLAAAVSRLAQESEPNYVLEGKISPDDSETLDVLHAYYAANHEALKIGAKKTREAAELALQNEV
ncbi:MAG: hypothetical protein Q8M02_08555 [Candidatus Didemnitutus sp.]|nr:hypothetical protein [Candidatus Didemnitutus sp.]